MKTIIEMNDELQCEKIELSTVKNSDEIEERSEYDKICEEVGSWHHESPINNYQLP